MLVSLIIRTRDEEKWIGKVLERVFTQKAGLPFEVIVVDSGSTDGTLSVAGKYDVRIVTILPEEFTYGYSLNFGIHHAAGEIVCLLSAHCIPADDRWLHELIRPITENGADATYGRQVPIQGMNPFEEVSLSKHFPEKGGKGNRVPFSNANCAFLKTMWQLQKFDEQIPSWEDYLWYLLLRDRFRFLYCPESAVYHSHPFSVQNMAERAYRDGRAFRILKDEYGIDVINTLCPSLRSKVRLFIDDLIMHMRHFHLWGYTRQMPLIPVVRLYKYMAYWKGYRTLGGTTTLRERRN